METVTIVVLVTTIVCGITIVLGTMVPSLAEGKAVVSALEAMARQPGMAGQISTTLFVALAMLESCAIYVLLICLILLFANPLLALIQ
ncbi:MAG: ATP synthase F0 subunit C [Chloroflexi bacterium]|nr:ATP synthase F0 subunit C [Chloroflexota bacterium]